MSTKTSKININGEKGIFYYKNNILDENDVKDLKNWLNTLEFREGQCISGKEIPRLQLWFQEKNKYFCETWKKRYHRWESTQYTEDLYTFQNKIVNKIEEIDLKKININSCLINKYRNGKDSIKPHRDSSISFGEYPTIIIYSLGDTRTLRFRQILYNENLPESLKVDYSKDPIDFELKSNSIFIMDGCSQKYFTHEILKNDSKSIRHSLTFREYIY